MIDRKKSIKRIKSISIEDHKNFVKNYENAKEFRPLGNDNDIVLYLIGDTLFYTRKKCENDCLEITILQVSKQNHRKKTPNENFFDLSWDEKVFAYIFASDTSEREVKKVLSKIQKNKATTYIFEQSRKIRKFFIRSYISNMIYSLIKDIFFS